MLTAQSHQKSYAAVRRRDLEFAVGNQVLLKVSPTKGIVRFGATRKLSLRYIGPFVIIARVGVGTHKTSISCANMSSKCM
jgi:hypothetical protein